MRKHFYAGIKLLLMSVIIGFCSIAHAQIIEEKGISCYGDSTGQIGVYAGFGTGPYTYQWSNGKISQIIDGLKAGTYSVTVTDNLSNDSVFTYTLINPAKITASYTVKSNSLWPVNNGSISINPLGGSGWYKYSIYDSLAKKTTEQTNPLFLQLASGSYYVTISDLYGCVRTDTLVVPENSGLPVVMNIDTTACYMSTAPADARPSVNGALPIIIRYDNSQFDTIIEIIPGTRPYVMSNMIDTLASIPYDAAPGFHLVTVWAADNKGFRYSWQVDSVVAPISIAWTQNNIACFGNNSGSITAIAQGSYNGFTYTITGPGGYSVNSANATNLFAGKYNIRGVDYTGCTLNQSVVIKQPDEPLRIVFDDVINTSCPAASDGKAGINRIDGALEPVNILWSNSKTTKEIDGLTAGTYIVTVMDANNCSATDSIVVKADKGPFQIFFDLPKNARCPYTNDGEIRIHKVDGVTPPITYQWSNGSNEQQIDSLFPGMYSVTVTDANDCIAIDSIAVKAEKGACIYNVITPNGDGLNDNFDLTDLCYGMKKNAVIFNETGVKVATLDENNPIWDGIDPSKPPTGKSSTYTVFIQVYKNDKIFMKWSESISVIYSK